MRCMAFGSSHDHATGSLPLYLGTNAGFVLQLSLFRQGSGSSGKSGAVPSWCTLAKCPAGGPFSCMAVEPVGEGCLPQSAQTAPRLLLGQHRGYAMAVAPYAASAASSSNSIIGGHEAGTDESSSTSSISITWQAHQQGTMLVFWCPWLCPGAVGTADASGGVRLWLLPPAGEQKRKYIGACPKCFFNGKLKE